MNRLYCGLAGIALLAGGLALLGSRRRRTGA